MVGPKANCRLEPHQLNVAAFAPPGSDSIDSPMEKVPCNGLHGRNRKVLVLTLGGFLTRIVAPPWTEYRNSVTRCGSIGAMRTSPGQAAAHGRPYRLSSASGNTLPLAGPARAVPRSASLACLPPTTWSPESQESPPLPAPKCTGSRSCAPAGGAVLGLPISGGRISA